METAEKNLKQKLSKKKNKQINGMILFCLRFCIVLAFPPTATLFHPLNP